MASNELIHLLTAWRQAERDIEAQVPGTVGHEIAVATAERLRAAYHLAQERALGSATATAREDAESSDFFHSALQQGERRELVRS